MLAMLLRLVFIAMIARLLSRVLAWLLGGRSSRPAGAARRSEPASRGAARRLDAVDAEFEDLNDGRR